MNQLTVRQWLWNTYNHGNSIQKALVNTILSCIYRKVHSKGLQGGYLESIEKFNPDITAEQKKSLLRDCERYQAKPDEYYLYHFESISDEKKRQFLMDDQRGLFTSIWNEPQKARLFRNKGETYKYFGEFYGRELLNVTEATKEEDIIAFITKHPDIIVKPTEGGMGKGIEIIHASERESIENMVEHVRKFKNCVIEELLMSDDFMQSLHPQSLNTIRVPTFLEADGTVTVFHPFLRVGRGDSIVDNAGSGGIFANIDAKTGIVITDGVDELGHQYKLHPDTNFRYKGLQIPRWNELLQLADKLARVLPTVRFVGFDLALTKNGWVMVEGNNNPQPVQQMVDQIGLRKEFDDMLARM